jgi:serpin B
MRARALTPLAALLLAACAESATAPRPIASLPRELSAAEQEVIAASNGFAFDLLRQVSRARPDDNVFLSPLSASMALGMTMNGARGSTFDAMRSTLGFAGLAQPEINASYRSLLDLLRGLDPSVQVLVANSIWYQADFPFRTEFLDTTRVDFDARVEAVDFEDASSIDGINDWVKENTGGKIEKILDSADQGAVMYLVNAVYFKGSWTQRFDPALTRDAPFHDAGGQRVVGTVRMMHSDGPARLYRGIGFQAIDLPYGAGAFSMTVILPDAGTTVDETLASLTPERWREVAAGLQDYPVPIELPKFRLEFGDTLDGALRALGMGVAFGNGPEPPDLSGMGGRPGDLEISHVLQKTFVNVDEEGTEAAAATSVGVVETSAPATLTIDRPFLFAIRERFSGTLLFVGRMMLPAAE